MSITRRSFIKSLALNSAAVTAATLFPGISFGAWKNMDSSSGGIEWKWCRLTFFIAITTNVNPMKKNTCLLFFSRYSGPSASTW